MQRKSQDLDFDRREFFSRGSNFARQRRLQIPQRNFYRTYLDSLAPTLVPSIIQELDLLLTTTVLRINVVY